MPRSRPPHSFTPSLRRAAYAALLSADGAPCRCAAGTKFDLIETRDLRLLYYGPTLGFIAPYTTQCFENSLNFYRRTMKYAPTERVNIFLDDWADVHERRRVGRPAQQHDDARRAVGFRVRDRYRLRAHRLHHEPRSGARRDARSGRRPPTTSTAGLFHGKVRETEDDPETIIYAYLTLPRRTAPRWHREGTAVFFETWMSGGLGRAQGPYDEMVLRSMVRDSAYFYDPLGLESEGTKADFQVGVNSYLYGTRFMTYMAYRDSPEKLVDWVSREPGSKALLRLPVQARVSASR